MPAAWAFLPGIRYAPWPTWAFHWRPFRWCIAKDTSSTVRAHGLGRCGTLESGCHTRRRFCRRRNAVLASAFSAIIVYAHDLVPGKISMISGLFFGLAFGMAGIGAAIMGWLADATSIAFVYRVCSFLPAIGLLTAFLPNLEMGYKRSGA